MSAADRRKRISVPEIQARKGGEPIVSLTAYSAPMASFLDPHTDLFIVGGFRSAWCSMGWTVPWV